ncbi:hypothetical protein THIOSC15_1830002 [uncultured Thiomicrorhabdus sp.]
MFVKIGRFGPYRWAMVKIKRNRGSSLMPAENGCAEAGRCVELFKLPREVGEMPESYSATAVDGSTFGVEAGQKLIAKQGPFGPYLEYGTKKYAPIKGYDPLSITLEEAVISWKQKSKRKPRKLSKPSRKMPMSKS